MYTIYSLYRNTVVLRLALVILEDYGKGFRRDDAARPAFVHVCVCLEQVGLLLAADHSLLGLGSLKFQKLGDRIDFDGQFGAKSWHYRTSGIEYTACKVCPEMYRASHILLAALHQTWRSK